MDTGANAPNNMTFTPKDVETLKTEALEDLGLEAYEGNEEVVDRVVARLKNAEDLKVSLHTQKTGTQDKLREARKLLGQDPETGEKLQANAVVEPRNEDKDLSGEDVFALMEAKVSKADLPLVKTTAKALGLSISEALNHSVTKTILKEEEEKRRTAQATNVGSGRQSTSKNSQEAIQQRIARGEVKDDEMQEAAKLVIAGWATK